MKKLLLLTVIIALLPLQLFAAEGLYGGSNGSNMSTTVENFLSFGGASPPTTVVNNSLSEAPFGGTMSNLYVQLAVAPGAGTSRTFTVKIAGSNTSITCTIADTATTCNDLTHSASFNAGDQIIMDATLSGAVVTTALEFSVRVAPTLSGDIMFTNRLTGGPTVSGTSSFDDLTSMTYNTLEGSTTQPIAVPGVFDLMRYHSPTNAGASSVVTLTLRQNFADSSLTCAVTGTGAGGTLCTDTTHSVAAVAGDLLDWKDAVSVGATLVTTHTLSMRFRPTDPTITTVLTSGSNNTAEVGAARYYSISGERAPSSLVNIAQTQGIIPFPTRLRSFYATTTAPGVGNSKPFIINVNGVDTGATCTVSGTAQNCSWQGVLPLNQGDLVTIKGNPSAGSVMGQPEFSMAFDDGGGKVILNGSLVIMGTMIIF